MQNASSGCCCQSAVCSLELACWYRVVLSKCGVCYQAWVLVLLQGVAGVYGSVDIGILWRLRLFRSKKGEYLVATKKYLLLSGVFAGVIFTYVIYIYIYNIYYTHVSMYMHIIISPNVLVNPHLCQILIFLEHQARSLQPTNGLSFHGTFRRSAGLFLLEMAKRSVLQGHILQGVVVNNPFFFLGFGCVTRLHILDYTCIFSGFSGRDPGMKPLFSM